MPRDPSTGSGRSLAIVIYSTFPHASGGRETWLAHMLPALAEAGYRTTLYAKAPPPAAPALHDPSTSLGAGLSAVAQLRQIESAGTGPAMVRQALLNAPVAWDIATFVRRTAAALETDGFGGGVVLGLGAIIDVAPGLRLRRRHPRTRVVCAVHGRVARELGHSLPWARPALGRMERRSLRACDAVVVNGEDTRAWLASFGVTSDVVPNGVDVAAFAPEPPALPPLIAEARARGEAVLSMVATLRDIKGIRPFIRALPSLRKRYGPHFRAVFVGKGDVERYRRYARQQGVEEHVWFAGEQGDVAPWLHGSDVCVNLSGGTGMAISAIEALAAGAPVVAWDSAIYRQIIEPERTGILVPEGDTEALAAALARILADGDLRSRLGKAGAVAARRFDWSEATPKLLATLEAMFAV